MAHKYGFQLNTTIHAAFWIYKPDQTLEPTGRETIIEVNRLQYIESNFPVVLVDDITTVNITGGVLTLSGGSGYGLLKPGGVVILDGFDDSFFLNGEVLRVVTASPTQATFKFTELVSEISASSIVNGVLTVVGDNEFVAGMTVTLNGMAESFLNGQTVTVLSATDTQFTAASPFNISLTAVDAATGSPPSSTVYVGTITGGAGNAYAGYYFTISGFNNPTNNGTFLAIASTATTLTLVNALSVNETNAGNASISYPNPTYACETSPDTGTATLVAYSTTAETEGQVIDPSTRKVWLFYAETNVSTSQAPRVMEGIGASKFMLDMEDLFKK
jgi:hypothetical protein